MVVATTSAIVSAILSPPLVATEVSVPSVLDMAPIVEPVVVGVLGDVCVVLAVESTSGGSQVPLITKNS